MDSAFPGRLTIESFVAEKLKRDPCYFKYDMAEHYYPDDRWLWVLGSQAGDFTTRDGCH